MCRAVVGSTLALLLACGTAASAAPLEKELPVGKDACWERIYDAAHLAAHPGQKVVNVKLIKLAESPEKGTEAITLYFNLRKRGAESDNGYDYSNTALCKPSGAGYSCIGEYKLGNFRIEAAPKGGLIVKNPGMWANPNPYDAEEKSKDAVSIPAKPDDGSWLLDRKTTENCPY